MKKTYLIFLGFFIFSLEAQAVSISQCAQFLKSVDRIIHDTLGLTLPGRIRKFIIGKNQDHLTEAFAAQPKNFYKEKMKDAKIVKVYKGFQMQKGVRNFALNESRANIETMLAHIDESMSLIKKNLKKVSESSSELEENLKEVKRLRQEIADLSKAPSISYLDYLKTSNVYTLLMDLKFSSGQAGLIGRGFVNLRADYQMRWEYFLRLMEEAFEADDILLLPTFKDLSIRDFNIVSGVPVKYLGLTNQIVKADGVELSPLLFFEHDLQHAQITAHKHRGLDLDKVTHFNDTVLNKISKIPGATNQLHAEMAYFHYAHEVALEGTELELEKLIDYYKKADSQDLRLLAVTIENNIGRDVSASETQNVIRHFLKALTQ